MTVNAVGKNDNTCLNTVAKSTAIGTATGYAMKYLWHTNRQEIGTSQRKLIKLGQKIANENKIDELVKFSERTPAQDSFIKIVEADKNAMPKRAFSFSNIQNEIKKLGGLNSNNGKEFKSLIKEVNTSADKMARHFNAAYRIILKYKRPAVPFLVAGAGAGFITGIIRNIVKNDV